MKKLRLFLGCCALMCCAAIQASVQIGDLYYDLNSSAKTAEVVKSDTYKSLTSVVIPDTVTSDGVKYAVKSISMQAFDGCSSLTSVNIPQGVTSIGRTAFYACSSLTTVVIPTSVTSIGEAAFWCCSSLTSVNIPQGVTSIGRSAFYRCTNLTSVVIPTSVTSIGENAFYACSSLTSVNIPQGVTSIGEHAFHGCSSLASVVIPTSVTSIGEYAFCYCGSLTSVNIPQGVTSIGEAAFDGCSSLTTINISNGITSIGNESFSGCSSLTEITLPSSVTSIGTNPFSYCPYLKSISIDAQNPSYTSENGIIYNKEKTKLISFPSATGSVNILTGVKDIGEHAFDCTDLTSITIPSSVESIGSRAFSICSKLTTISIPSSVTSIGDYAFGSCYALNTVTIPSIIVNRFKSAFSSCPVNSVTVTSTGGNVNMANSFNGFSDLRSVTLSSDIVSIGTNTFLGCTNLQSINIPSNVTSIGTNAFLNCSSLKSLTIPANVTSIDVKAFSGCTSLSSVTLPSSLTDLKAYAFDGCTNLKKVNCLGTVPTTGTSVFNGNDLSKDTLCVEAVNLKAYRDSTTWKDFGTIRALTSTESSSYNTLALEDTTVYMGTQIKLPLLMNNLDSITAFQFDLYLPAGITVAKQDGNYMVDLGERTTLKNHTLSSALQSDGAIRVVVYSGSNAAFLDHSGTVAYITLNIADSVAEGSYPITIKNMVLSSVKAVAYNVAQIQSTLTVAKYLLGDVNNNGIINVNDAVAIVNKLLGKSSTSFLAKAADVDKDGNITINDVVMLINKYILNLSTSSAKARYAGTAAHNMATLDAEPININAGEEHTMNIALNNPSDAITAFQFDVNLPKGFSIVKDADGNYSQLAEGRNMNATHQLGSNMLQNGDLRVACFSANNAVIAGQSGAVAAICIKADANVPNGTYYLTLHNAVLAHPDGMNSIAPAEQRIAINVGTTGIENAENSGLQITAGKGIITLKTSTMQAVQIAAVNGMRVATFTLQAGESRTLKVAAGLYIVNGKKVVVE